MVRLIRKFFTDTSGAVTVDWVVLTAAVTGFAISATISITNGTSGMSDDVATFMETDTRLIQNR